MTAWTQERRDKMAALMRERKPWLKSTGPRSPEGKQRSAANARKAKTEEVTEQPPQENKLEAAQPEPVAAPAPAVEPVAPEPEIARDFFGRPIRKPTFWGSN